MAPLSPEQTNRILANPSFRELAAARSRRRWGPSLITLVTYRRWHPPDWSGGAIQFHPALHE